MAEDNNSFKGLLGTVLDNAAKIGGNYLDSQNKPKPAPAPKPAAAPSANWMPWAIGGGVLLLVVVLFFGMSKRKA